MTKPKTTARPPLVLVNCEQRRRETYQKETLEILQALEARALRGEVIGLAICFRAPGGDEQCLFTGPYKTNPAEAMNAAVRMQLGLARIQDDVM